MSNASSLSVGVRPKSASQLQKDEFERGLATKKDGDQQLALFQDFQSDIPPNYTVLYELYDTIPKFSLTPSTSERKGQSLSIVKKEFMWGDRKLSATITPVVVESKNSAGESVRKEILPGPREETIYRVLKKMAADTQISKQTRSNVGVVMSFTLTHLRSRLKLVGHEFKIPEIREALEVLNRSAIDVTDVVRRKRMYSGSHIYLNYVIDESVAGNEYGRVEVGFNALAANAINSKTYDRIHYNRLMSLSPLGAWIYELMTRNFRQAAEGMGYKLSLSRILAESGMPVHKRIRSNVMVIRRTFGELIEREVLAAFPRYNEEVQYAMAVKTGRRPIQEVIWTIYPSLEVVRDIREDNGVKSRRRDGSKFLPR